jgi:FkbM family methyltransferase
VTRPTLSDIERSLKRTGEWQGYRGDPLHAQVFVEMLVQDEYGMMQATHEHLIPVAHLAAGVQTTDVDRRRRSRPPADIRPGDTVLDLGAHIGLFSRRALELGAGHVVAVEPHPENSEHIRRNTEEWSDRITIIQAAVDHRSGRTHYTSGPHSNRGTTSPLRKPRGKFHYEVDAVSCASLLWDHKPDVVKCDIEGSEYFTLAQLGDGALSIPRQYIGELHITNPRELAHYESVITRLRDAGYELAVSGAMTPTRPESWGKKFEAHRVRREVR